MSSFSATPPGKTYTPGINLDSSGLFPIKTRDSFFPLLIIIKVEASLGLTSIFTFFP